MRTSLVVFPLLLAIAGLTAAEDRLILTDGRTIDGTYLGGDAQEVRLRYGATDLIIPRDKVQRIDLGAVPTTATNAPVAVVPSAAPQVTYITQPVSQPPPQVIYVNQPAPQVIYAPEPYRPQPYSWYVGTGWYGSPWRHPGNHCGWNRWSPGLTIGIEGNFRR